MGENRETYISVLPWGIVISSVYLRCIAHATEDIEKVEKAMEFISGRRDFKITKKKGYYGNEIRIIELTIKNKKEIKKFWSRMKELGALYEIYEMSDDIMDSRGVIHLRFDKQEAYLGRLAISMHGDVIVLKAKVQSYPMKKEKALKNFKDYLNSV